MGIDQRRLQQHVHLLHRPGTAGRERDRRPGDILAEIQALVSDGVSEVTLLGQNVNAYGSDFGARGAFAELLRAGGDIEGLRRLRFTSPHPRDFTDDVIAAMAETRTSCPICMPLQSGKSDDVLKRMRRFGPASSIGCAAMPEAAITTDIIVGFPETEADFEDTLGSYGEALRWLLHVQYSNASCTPAARWRTRYRPMVAALPTSLSMSPTRSPGRRPEAAGPRGGGVMLNLPRWSQDGATHPSLTGRARDNRLVPGSCRCEPGAG